MLYRTFTFAIALALAGCVAGSSEEDVQAEWDAFVEEYNACQTVDDCTKVGPGCPLGCSTGINRMYEAEAIELANDLIGEYERAGQTCDYVCMPTELVCEGEKCDVRLMSSQ